MTNTFEQVRGQLDAIRVIDTHEHLPPYENRRDRTVDVLGEYLSHYMSSDLVAAGLTLETLDKACRVETPIKERWLLLEPYWNWCRHTGYGRALDRTVKGLYGIDGIHGHTIEVLNQAFLQTRDAPGHFRHVLRERCNIEMALLDAWCDQSHFDPELFRPVWHPTAFVTGAHHGSTTMLQWIREHHGINAVDLDGWLQAFVMELEGNLTKGTVALKNAMAYERTLYYDHQVTHTTAQNLFADAVRVLQLHSPSDLPQFCFPKPLQDYLMHKILQECNDRGLVMQVHTGLQEGNGNYIHHSDPALLSNLLLRYPNVHFDLFHIGYPYQNTVSALAKNFPNVTIDLCWAHIISPAALRAALADYLDAVPYNKIMAFGGDYLFIDAVYGHLEMAKDNIASVLTEKIELGVFDFAEALHIAEHMFYGNPKRVFGLDMKSPGITC